MKGKEIWKKVKECFGNIRDGEIDKSAVAVYEYVCKEKQAMDSKQILIKQP